MKYFQPKEVELQLGIKTATLRKYATKLEEVGYEFQKNPQGHRYYSDQDVMALRKLITIKDETGKNVGECAEHVVNWANGSDAHEEVYTEEPVREIINETREVSVQSLSPGALESIVFALQRQEAMLEQQAKFMIEREERFDERIGKMQEALDEFKSEQLRFLTEQKIITKGNSSVVEETKDILKKTELRDSTLHNQMSGMRKDVNQILTQKKEEETEKNGQQKSRSWWQRLTGANSTN